MPVSSSGAFCFSSSSRQQQYQQQQTLRGARHACMYDL